MADGGKAGINTKSDFRSAKADKFAKSNMAKIIEGMWDFLWHFFFQKFLPTKNEILKHI